MDPVTIGLVAVGIVVAYWIGRRSKPGQVTERAERASREFQAPRPLQMYRHRATDTGGLRPDPNSQLPEKLGDEEVARLRQSRVQQGAPIFNSNSSTFRLSSDQQRVVDYLKAPHWDSQIVAVLGAAGTGKSTVLHYLSSSQSGLRIAKVAPTGIAARNIGGSTIHSLFKLPPTVQPIDGATITRFAEGSNQLVLLEQIDILVIDEISMVRADLLDAIDRSLRKNLRINEPFAGKKVVMFGDPMQLEPVVKRDESEYIADNWRSPFFFDAKVFDATSFLVFNLTEIHRHNSDHAFATALNSLRTQTPTGLTAINSRTNGAGSDDATSLKLVTTNRMADGINQRALACLPGSTHTFLARVIGDFDETGSNLPCDKEITLRLGTEVLVVVNGAEYANGSRGVVIEINHVGIKVLLDSGVVTQIPVHSWEQVEHFYDREANTIVPKLIGKFIQIPVKLGWAITIHKSQGMTLDRAHLDLGNGAFCHGQTYVGLSRVRRMDGLSLERPVRESDLLVNQRVLQFLDVGFDQGAWGSARLPLV